MSDHHDRARLITREERVSLQQQQQQLVVVSDEASHVEQRAERMGQIGVGLMSYVRPLKKKS